MTLTHKVLRGVSLSVTAVGVLFAIIALLSWLQAIMAWGNPRPFSTAMLWSLGAIILFALSIAVKWVQERWV